MDNVIPFTPKKKSEPINIPITCSNETSIVASNLKLDSYSYMGDLSYLSQKADIIVKVDTLNKAAERAAQPFRFEIFNDILYVKTTSLGDIYPPEIISTMAFTFLFIQAS